MNPTENLGTEDWSDDEIVEVTPPGVDKASDAVQGDANDDKDDNLHADVAAQLANFDKQFLPSTTEQKQ